MSIMPQTVFDDEYLDTPLVVPGRMTEEEFENWCRTIDEKARVEWVDGEVIVMSPVNYDHADLNHWLSIVLGTFVGHFELGVVLGPEFFVRFAKQRRRRLPDILFVQESRRDLIRRTYLDGAPDLAIEIVSPDSVARDREEKYAEYRTVGVREYWVIDPATQLLSVYSLDQDGEYNHVDEKDGIIRSTVLPGFFLRTSWLWRTSRPKIRSVFKELGIL
jgi:Uma2 family endonuclease